MHCDSILLWVSWWRKQIQTWKTANTTRDKPANGTPLPVRLCVSIRAKPGPGVDRASFLHILKYPIQLLYDNLTNTFCTRHSCAAYEINVGHPCLFAVICFPFSGPKIHSHTARRGPSKLRTMSSDVVRRRTGWDSMQSAICKWYANTVADQNQAPQLQVTSLARNVTR